MKLTQWVDALRNIKLMRSSFISVCAISLLSVCVYLGVLYASQDMHEEFSTFYNDQSFWDLEVDATRLLKNEDVEQIEALDGVENAEGVKVATAYLSADGELREVNAVSVTTKVALSEVVEGRLPENDKECAVEFELAQLQGIHVGDVIELTDVNGEQVAAITGKKYQVTGIVHHPDHIAYGISVTFYVLLTKEAFDDGGLEDCYAKAIIRLSDMPEDRFTDAYFEALKPVRQRVEELSESRCALRDEELEKLARDLAMLPEGQGKAMLSAIPGGSSRWLVLTNWENTGYRMAEQNAGNLITLSLTLSLLFLVVAVMVIYACTARMVEEQSVLVGGLKASGLYNREIIGKYLVFALGAGCIGVALGIFLAWIGLQKYILFVYGSYFVRGLSSLAFLPIPAIIAGLIVMAASFLAAIFACSKMLRASALELLNGAQKVKRGKAKTGSGKGNYYFRMILINMGGNLKRVIVTIVSIAGCCTLLMIGFMLYYGITRVAPRQYGEIQSYNYVIKFSCDQNAEAENEIAKALGEAGVKWLPVTSEDLIFRANDKQNACCLICTDAGKIEGWLNEIDVNTGKLAMPSDDGVMVGRRFTEYYGVPEEGEFTLYDAGYVPHKVKVSGVINNYLYEIMLTSPAAWEKIFGEKPKVNCFFVKSNGISKEALSEKISAIQGFDSLKEADADRAMFDALEDTSVSIAGTFICLAGMMAWFILMNLSSVYMMQKAPELAIMRVNGFTIKECLTYAAAEPMVTTSLGILSGLGIGTFLGGKIVRMLEQAGTQFARDVDWRSMALSVLFTLSFALIINGLSLRRVRNLKISR